MTDTPPDLSDRELLVVFIRKLNEFTDEYSRGRAIGETLKWGRDHVQVNFARILDRNDYVIPSPDDSLYRINVDFSDRDEEWFQLWDPVFSDAIEGSANDIREGDVIVSLDGDGNEHRAEVIFRGAGYVSVRNAAGEENPHPVATVRNTLKTTPARLERDGEELIGPECSDPLGNEHLDVKAPHEVGETDE